jgi:hypothetical protein
MREEREEREETSEKENSASRVAQKKNSFFFELG